MALLRMALITSTHGFARDILALHEAGVAFFMHRVLAEGQKRMTSRFLVKKWVPQALDRDDDMRSGYNYVIYIRECDEMVARMVVNAKRVRIIPLKEWQRLDEQFV